MRISEVARAAGCSVRAVRHYHLSGALPEPERSSNGYREYGIGDLTDLLRVRTLVEAGIPLTEITSGGQLYPRALVRIDARLAELTRQRRRLLALQAGTLGLPADIRKNIEELAGDAGVARLETDSLELMGLTGVATEQTWRQLRDNLADPARRRVIRQGYAIWHLLGQLRADDPAAVELIQDLARFMNRGLMAGVLATLQPGDLPLTTADIPTTGAQSRALSTLAESELEP